MRFADIPGHTSIKEQLIRAARNDSIAHAQLFAGPEGCPNLALALAFATYLNCEHPTENDSCGICSACSKNSKFVHPDLHFAFPVSGTKNVKTKDAVSQAFLKDWRRFLLEQPFGDLVTWATYYGGEDKQVNISREESRQIIRALTLKAFEGKYKIMLIWLPEYFHPSAANGLLKILEEPPERTLFLLVSSDPERLITTILSRTQRVQIPAFTPEEVTSLLVDRYQTPEHLAHEVSTLADGSIAQALKLKDDVEDNNQEQLALWMRNCYNRELELLVRQADDFQRSNKLAQKGLLQFSLFILRECVLYHHAPELCKGRNGELDFVKNFSKVMTPDKADRISQLVSESLYHLERNGSPRMTHLDLSLSIMQIMRS